MKNVLTVPRLFTLVFVGSLLGCAHNVNVTPSTPPVEVRNHTPSQFPYSSLSVPASMLYPASTPEQLRELWQDPAHRFVLEVEVRSPRIVTGVDITVNNVTHPMSLSPPGLWLYESPDECQPVYWYRFTVHYENFSQPFALNFPPPAFPPFDPVFVTGFGDVIWVEVPTFHIAGIGGDYHWPPSTHVQPTQFWQPSFPLWFLLPSMDERTFILQNLRSAAVEVSIGLDNAPEFELLDGFPPTSFDLQCGESFRFRIGWNGQTNTASGTLTMSAISTVHSPPPVPVPVPVPVRPIFSMSRSLDLLGTYLPH